MVRVGTVSASQLPCPFLKIKKKKKNFVCLTLHCVLYQSKMFCPPTLSITGFFTDLLTEDILFPKRKASEAPLLETLGETQTKTH